MSVNWKRYLTLVGPIAVGALLLAAFVPSARGLVALFFYSIPSNSFIPVPHELGMIYFGQYYQPALVALVAAAGTVVACFIDYQVINRAFETERLRNIRKTDVYQGAVYYFLRAPFLSVALAGALPFIPFYLFRVLSPTSGYSLKRYMLAVFIGRLPRYYVFALMGSTLGGYNLAITLLLILGACLFISRHVKRHLARGHVKRSANELESVPFLGEAVPTEEVLAD